MAEQGQVEGWLAGRLPEDWFTGPAEVGVDREEILVVGTLAEPEGVAGDPGGPEAAEAANEAGAEAHIAELRNHVAKEIGPIAKPRSILVVPELPKTRSGKIMRRLLRDVAENRAIGDVTTLADSSVMDQIAAGMAK